MIIDFHTHHPTAEGVFSPRSFGIHPWHSAHWLSLHSSDPQESLSREMPSDIVVVGECGLDKCCDAPWGTQERVFETQLRWAELHLTPVVIHCVRAYNEVCLLRRLYPHEPWIIHGFSGSPQLAVQLARLNIDLSFGAALLDARRDKVRQSFILAWNNPEQRVFLETDEAAIDIRDIYRQAAQLLNIDQDSVADTINRNYLSLIEGNINRP